MGLFRKYTVQTNTRLVKDDSSLLDDITEDLMDAADPFLGPKVMAEYSEIAKDFVTHTALTIGGTYIACRIAKALFK